MFRVNFSVDFFFVVVYLRETKYPLNPTFGGREGFKFNLKVTRACKKGTKRSRKKKKMNIIKKH
jgi:hypothetical protein